MTLFWTEVIWDGGRGIANQDHFSLNGWIFCTLLWAWDMYLVAPLSSDTESKVSLWKTLSLRAVLPWKMDSET